MDYRFPIDVLMILKALQHAGYEAYIVGGAVRDMITKHQLPTDWDFTTNATPSQIQAIFPESFYENEFGTVAVTRDDVRTQFELPLQNDDYLEIDQQYHKTIQLEEATKLHESLVSVEQSSHHTKPLFEITTFRSDGSYTDFRRPDVVSWGETLEGDLHRRDFTFNAMAIHIDLPILQKIKTQETITLLPSEVTFIDPHHGLQDIETQIVRTVGMPSQRFQEDALRMLRALRFSVQLGYKIEGDTFTAIIDKADLIKHVSWERIRDEFLKMLASPSPRKAIEQLDETGLLKHLLPELTLAKGVAQGGHHKFDVWNHSLGALEMCPSKDPIVRFATLVHDISKPTTYSTAQGKITFYNHELLGARVAKKIADRFKLSKKDSQRMFLLVRHHMFYYQPHNTDASIRRFMRKVGLENINDILDLRIGDRLGSGSTETSWRLEEMKERMQAQLHQPFSIKDLAINGHDLIEHFNLKPGPILGKILKELFQRVLEQPALNDKESLLNVAELHIFPEKNNFFTYIDVFGTTVRATKAYWTKITQEKHVELTANIEMLKIALSAPDEVYQSITDEFIKLFYSRVNGQNLVVVVEYIGEHGYLVTCYQTSKLKRKGTKLWPK